MMAVPDACPGDRAQCGQHCTRSDQNRSEASIIANRCVRDSARVFNPNPPRDPQQASDLLARQIVDGICKNVVDHPETWRRLAIEEIALQLDVAGRRGLS
jgi:hypothetical protein